MEKVEIESFNPETGSIENERGTTLSLKNRMEKFLAYQKCQPVTKAKPVKKNTPPPNTGRRVITSGGRTITIPPRSPFPTPRK